MLTGKQRAFLKQEAHDFKPIINIGKFSVTDDLIKAIDEALQARELIKIKILNNNMDDQDEIIDTIIDKTSSEFISHLGSIFTLYRKNEDNKYGL
ncbi:ribosome assembly RNA-binding protein YhbY [Anaerococcus tetradius]|uniref:RNA-binding protein, YhbY family n=1 Tax=Anaerococcus tetradius ATCC 35098 TaxID=525255 RepID=C2CFN8_9FIRM|nr:ribosome assembly RNA-binding protein YhbY [Anaerococcus tetradius]EEI83569.1 RNA-binding protein, YhbY family [Anaerococcus tetradius ATCC 35098]